MNRNRTPVFTSPGSARVLVAAALLLLAPPTLRAATEVQSVTVTNHSSPTSYLIGADAVDGDPATERHIIRVDVTGQYEPLFPGTPATYRLLLRIRDENAAIIHIHTTDSFSISHTTVRTDTVELTPGPAVVLDARLVHYIEATIQRGMLWQNIDSGAESPGRRYYHFASTDPDDAARNVLAEVTSATCQRTHLVGDASANNGRIPVSVTYVLRRFDAWDAPAERHSINIILECQLYDAATGEPVTSTVTTDSISRLLWTHNNDTPRTPSVTAPSSRTIYLDPGAQLASASKEYYVVARIRHLEVVSPAEWKEGREAALAAQRFLHFNGALSFGGIHTHFTDLAVAPTGTTVHSGHVATTIEVLGGSLDTDPARTFTSGPLAVNLHDNGNAVVTSGMVKPERPDPDLATAPGGFHWERTGAVYLSETGASCEAELILPVGLGWAQQRKMHVLSSRLHMGTTALRNDLQPLANSITITGSRYFIEETKKVRMLVSSVTWSTRNGRLDFQAGEAVSIQAQLADELNLVAHLLKHPGMVEYRTNDGYYVSMDGRIADMSVEAGPSGDARLSVEWELGGGESTGHFPWGASLRWTRGTIRVVDDLIDPDASFLQLDIPVPIPFSRHVLTGPDDCGITTPAGLFLLSADDSILRLTPDGGLWGEGAVNNHSGPLNWGALPEGRFVHQLSDAVPRGNVLFSGHFLRGDQYGAPRDDGPGVLHLSGVDPDTLQASERPGTQEYLRGFADYAGLNLRLTSGDVQAESRIAGSGYGPYTLKARSKYYLRLSGVSGIHDADEQTIPQDAVLWGYPFGFVTFGTGYLSNENVVSRIRGAVMVPYPADVRFDFEQMMLSSTGALTGGQLEDGPVTGLLRYWNAPYTAHSIAFVSEDGCDPGAGGHLGVGVELAMSHFPVTLAGQLGLKPDGQIISPSDKIDGLESRFALPARLTLNGRMGRNYTFTPVQQAYLNREADAPDSSPGFWSLYGRLDVPFFEDVRSHLHVRTTSGDTVSPVYLMGGWPTHGWQPGGTTPFEDGVFDPEHRGFPTTLSLAAYRAAVPPPNHNFRPRATRKWLGGLLDFTYPLKWHTSQRYFTAAESAKNVDLLVLKGQHQLEYLGPDLAHISFGIQYDGLPRINLANALTNHIDEATGFTEVLTRTLTEPLFDQLERGLETFSSMVTDQVDSYVIGVLDHQIDPVIDAFITELVNALQTGGANAQAEAEDVIKSFFTSTGSFVPPTTLVTALNKLGDAIGEAGSLLTTVDAKLAGIEDLIDSIIDGIPDPEVPGDFLPGFLYNSGEGALPTLQNLAVAIVDVLVAIYVAPELTAQIESLIAQIQGPADQIREILHEVKGHVSGLRERLDAGGDLLLEIESITSGAGAELQAVIEQAQADMLAYVALLNSVDYGQAHLLGDEIKARIRGKIMDGLAMTDVVRGVTNCMRDRVFDLREGFTAAMDSLFDEVNRVLRDVLSTALQEVDNTINRGLGDLGDVIGAGCVTGFAHINNDSLERLRLDALFQLKVPNELEFAGYLDIKQRRSDGPPGCDSGKHDLYEVALGALRVPVSWTGSGLKADIGLKFNIWDNNGVPIPLGLGGSFETVEGVIDFETAQITKLGAAAMFSASPGFSGVEEAYLAAMVRVRFSASELAGGVFFGRSCTLDPIEMVDPMVATILGPPPFTGVYVYGEGTFPVVDFSCLFRVSAGAGVGVFYFVEGPTYGGRMNAHVSGEALCLVSVRGDIDLVGLKRGSDYSFSGRGGIKGKAGVCPFCLRFSKSVGILYKNSKWSVDY